jgi:hypothetical protein
MNTDPQPWYSVLFTLYSVLCTLCFVLHTLYSVLCTLYFVLCTLYFVLCTCWLTSNGPGRTDQRVSVEGVVHTLPVLLLLIPCFPSVFYIAIFQDGYWTLFLHSSLHLVFFSNLQLFCWKKIPSHFQPGCLGP